MCFAKVLIFIRINRMEYTQLIRKRYGIFIRQNKKGRT